MLELKQAREIKGSVCLPPCPDLYFLSACIAIVTGTETHITAVGDSPLVASIENRLAGQADFVHEEDKRIICPKKESDSTTIALPYPELPYADLVVFMLMGAGKTLVFEGLPQSRIDRWRRSAETIGGGIETNVSGNRVALYQASNKDFSVPKVPVPPNALHSYLGLALGRRMSVTLKTEYPFTSPLRHVLAVFGLEAAVRSNTTAKDADPLTKRLRFMGVKRKEQTGPVYIISADFSVKPESPVQIELPGDQILASTLLVAKSVVQRGALTIENVPLESWASGMVNLLRKMGCKPGMQETRRGSYGAIGMVQLQAFTVQGRKTECVPLFQHSGHLPAMVVLSCFAKGQSVFRRLELLRDDRPDPIEQMLYCVRMLGGRHGEMPDGMVIDAAHAYDGFDLEEELPASMAAACAAGALRCTGKSTIADRSLCYRWPSFKKLLDSICTYRS
ncbi:MAG: hypothetical protein GF344_10125 [Chitinivibrionales bacterium]|nr:hypothetical protein [Chitinivibrionales bacterium]MBD3357191.1 hypothetical protein [Chitinivibrionales bacterium]